jgi:hypothetical protein
MKIKNKRLYIINVIKFFLNFDLLKMVEQIKNLQKYLY